MPVKSANSEAVRAAVQRILDGDPLRAPNCDLLDANLVLEAGVSRATLYRCEGTHDHVAAGQGSCGCGSY